MCLYFQVWDVTRSQVFVDMREHERRVWSVDFSIVDPTKLVSGSDDGSVKLWDMNQAILFLHLLYVSFWTNDNMVIEPVYVNAELFLSTVITHFHDLCRLGVLALLEQGQMCALCNFNLILLAPLPSARQITKFTAMISVTYELLIVQWLGTQKQ